MIEAPFFMCLSACLAMKKKLKMLVRKVVVELLFGELGEALCLVLLGRVVHQNVEPPELFHCLPDAALAERLVTHIARDLDGVAAFLFDQLDRLVGDLVLFKVEIAMSAPSRAMASRWRGRYRCRLQ